MWARSICNSLSWFMYGFKSVRLAWPVRRFVSALFFYMFPSLKSRQLLFRLRFFFYLECGICFNLSHTTCTNLRHYIVTYFLFEYFHPYRKNTTCPTCWPSPYWTSILGNLSYRSISFRTWNIPYQMRDVLYCYGSLLYGIIYSCQNCFEWKE